MSDQLFRKNQNLRRGRQAKIIKERSESWLIVCEGTKTEPNYLNSLIKFANKITGESPLNVKVEGIGKNTETLVNNVEAFFEYVDKQTSQKIGIPYAKTFVLFDKDSFKPQQFNNAILMAESRGYIPIWSNECFELWYILHYEYYDCDNGRKEYFGKLTRLIGSKYDKADNVFELIHSPNRIKNALKYSKKLNEYFRKEKSAAKKVPCTQMFKLVEEIQSRLKIDLTKS